MKRLLDCTASDMKGMTAKELKQAILASEGRTVLSENIVSVEPLLSSVTNSELAAAFGADLLLLNAFDCYKCEIKGLPQTDSPIELLKNYTGRPIGLNLEPVDTNANMMEDTLKIPKGRIACEDTFKLANKLGFDFVCLTGNPKTGVTNKQIEDAIILAKKYFDGLIFAGKMHSSGVNEPVVDLKAIGKFIDNGADVILMPAVGTVPGFQESELHEAVEIVKAKGALSMSTIGTSQEGADITTIREFALSSKRAGVDIQHMGDSGYEGIATPENIMALAIAIRGKRHTYKRMARSINR